MRIAIGNDHAGVEMKLRVMEHLENRGCEIVNIGNDDPTDRGDDYPIYGYRVGRLVAEGKADLGICICGTGVGICQDFSAKNLHFVQNLQLITRIYGNFKALFDFWTEICYLFRNEFCNFYDFPKSRHSHFYSFSFGHGRFLSFFKEFKKSRSATFGDEREKRIHLSSGEKSGA